MKAIDAKVIESYKKEYLASILSIEEAERMIQVDRKSEKYIEKTYGRKIYKDRIVSKNETIYSRLTKNGKIVQMIQTDTSKKYICGNLSYEIKIDENGEDTQLRSIARQLIETELGRDLEDFIRENSRDAVEVEKQKLLWGDNCDSTTQEDLLEAMCNIEEEEGKANIFTKGIYGTLGIVTKGFDALFGGGKKH